MRDMRDPMEKQNLWLVFAKIFSKPQTYGKKVEETEVNTVLLFNFPNIYGRHIQIHRQR